MSRDDDRRAVDVGNEFGARWRDLDDCTGVGRHLGHEIRDAFGRRPVVGSGRGGGGHHQDRRSQNSRCRGCKLCSHQNPLFS
jgi:hypothetical protein